MRCKLDCGKEYKQWFTGTIVKVDENDETILIWRDDMDCRWTVFYNEDTQHLLLPQVEEFTDPQRDRPDEITADELIELGLTRAEELKFNI